MQPVYTRIFMNLNWRVGYRLLIRQSIIKPFTSGPNVEVRIWPHPFTDVFYMTITLTLVEIMYKTAYKND